MINKNILDLIGLLQDKLFPRATALSCAKHLAKEAQELVSAIETGNPEQVRFEWADTFLLLIAVIRKFGIPLEFAQGAVAEKLFINAVRDWGKPNDEGFQEHVRNETPTQLSAVRATISISNDDFEGIAERLRVAENKIIELNIILNAVQDVNAIRETVSEIGFGSINIKTLSTSIQRVVSKIIDNERKQISGQA